MKKSYSYYYKKAQKLNAFVNAKNKSSLFKRALYLMISFIGKLFIFSRPIFAVADYNYMMMMEKTHNFSFLKIFEGVTKNGKYLHLLGAYFVADVVAAVLFLAVTYPCVTCIILYGYSLTPIVSGLLYILAIVPVFVVIGLYPNISGLGYLGCKTSEFDMGDYFYASFEGVKDYKGAILGVTFVKFLVAGIVISLPYLVPFIVGMINSFPDLQAILAIIAIVLGFLLVLATTPYFLNHKMARYLCFEDNMVTERSIVVKQNAGTKVSYSPLFKDEVSGKENE